MADKGQGKVEIKIGNLNFTAEGDQEWLGEQLSKVIKAAEAVVPNEPIPVSTPGVNSAEVKGPTGASNESLASYLKAKGGETKQVQRFLATAGWLHRRGTTQLDPTAVANALSAHHQKRLANPADCLNQNCRKGLCEKTKDGHFFITAEGWNALGEKQ